jgi:Fic family protein
MIYIHERSAWPKLRWQSARLAAPLAGVRHDLGRLLGRMEALGFELRAEANLSALSREILATSAIEGERHDPAEVRSSLARRLCLDAAGLPPAGRAVEGIVEVMLDATRNFRQPLTVERLWAWHAALFPTGRSGMTRIAVGAWRREEQEPMQVVSGPLGRERVHFEAPAAHRIDAEIAKFLEWFEVHDHVDPVLKAGLAHFHFVTIHPFEDGNGRIARAVAELALARADGIGERYFSMSAQIVAERKDYYDALEAAQRGGLDLTPWLAWFLGCLQRAVARSDELLAAVYRKAAVWRRLQGQPVNARQRLVVNRLLDDFEGKLTTSKYAQLAKCSSDTALRDVQELMEWGVLVQNEGGGRSVSYRLSSD